MTVRIILEAFAFSTKILRRRLGSLLLYRVTFALCSSEMLHARMTKYTVRMTRIQNVIYGTKTITTRFKQEWKLFVLGTQTFWTCSKLSYQPAEAIRTRRTLFELIVIVIVIARMTRNDQEWSLEQTRIVNSSSFGSRFGTVGLGHYSLTTHPALYRGGWAGTLQNYKLQIANCQHFFFTWPKAT